MWRIPFLDVPETNSISEIRKQLEKMFHLWGDFENLQKECDNSENLKNMDEFGEEGIVQLRKEKGEK